MEHVEQLRPVEGGDRVICKDPAHPEVKAIVITIGNEGGAILDTDDDGILETDVKYLELVTDWETFTRRTDDPKLAWLERQLTAAGIEHKREGKSFHAPILKVRTHELNAAWDILEPVDDVPDDDPRWNI
jgi:hypothetical protein